MPDVSVIIPTYNRANLLSAAIESVLAQTYSDYELLIVDDGSTDNTRDVVLSYTDPRIRYLHKNNGGLASARNFGLREAQGRYVAFLDDDDLYLPDKLAIQVNFLDAHPDVGWVNAGYLATDMQGNVLEEVRPWLSYSDLGVETWLFACPAVVHAVQVRREWLEHIGGFDDHFRASEDWDAWLRLAYAGCTMQWVEEIVCVYRFHGDNMVRAVQAKSERNIEVLLKFFSLPDLPTALLQKREAALAQMYLRNAASKFQVALIDEAKQDVLAALHGSPQLAANGGEKIYEMLLGYAGSPLVDDPIAYTHCVVMHLRPILKISWAKRRKLIGTSYMAQFFRAIELQDWRKVRGMGLGGVFYDPRWLKNRGVLANLLRAFLGAKVTRVVKILGQRLNR